MVLRDRKPAYPHKNHNKTLYIDKDVGSSVVYLSVDDIKGYRKHARKYSKRQRKLMERCIREFGFVLPILIDNDGTVIAGYLRLMVAKAIGYTKVPVIRITHLTPAQVRALRIADNRLAELGEWDQELLAIELQDLIELDYDLDFTGFEAPEIDLIIGDALTVGGDGSANEVPDVELVAVSRLGDLWFLDEHTVLCADAGEIVAYDRLLDARIAQMAITDPPYNVKIRGNVSGLGNARHDEFVMASGEMFEADYEAFLIAFIRNLVRFSLVFGSNRTVVWGPCTVPVTNWCSFSRMAMRRILTMFSLVGLAGIGRMSGNTTDAPQAPVIAGPIWPCILPSSRPK